MLEMARWRAMMIGRARVDTARASAELSRLRRYDGEDDEWLHLGGHGSGEGRVLELEWWRQKTSKNQWLSEHEAQAQNRS